VRGGGREGEEWRGGGVVVEGAGMRGRRGGSVGEVLGRGGEGGWRRRSGGWEEGRSLRYCGGGKV